MVIERRHPEDKLVIPERSYNMMNLKKILCPIDYSEYSKEALKYAVSFAMNDEAKLYLLHVIDMRTVRKCVKLTNQVPR